MFIIIIIVGCEYAKRISFGPCTRAYEIRGAQTDDFFHHTTTGIVWLFIPGYYTLDARRLISKKLYLSRGRGRNKCHYYFYLISNSRQKNN
jgi:hypothetical protein